MSSDPVDLDEYRRKKRETSGAKDREQSDHTTPHGDSPDAEALAEAERKNKENEERMKKERSKANTSVLRSYRIKN